MNNPYEVPEALELGRAQDVIVGQKQICPWVESLGVPFGCEPDVLDDFDE